VIGKDDKDGKDETWRIRNEKRYAPKKDGGEFRRRKKSDAQKIRERDERDEMVAKMRKRLR